MEAVVHAEVGDAADELTAQTGDGEDLFHDEGAGQRVGEHGADIGDDGQDGVAQSRLEEHGVKFYLGDSAEKFEENKVTITDAWAFVGLNANTYDANNNIYAKNSIGKIWGVNRKEGV